MIPFNLDEYLKNPSREVVTRDGYPVKIICTNFHLSGYPIVAEIDDKEYRTKQSWTFDKNGQYDMCGKNHRKDLFFAPVKREGWINIYKYADADFDYGVGLKIFDTQRKAELSACGKENYINTIKIEWEADE